MPHLTMVHFTSGDTRAHRSGYHSIRHRAGLAAYDRLVGRMVDALDRAGLRARTAIFIVSDHGFFEIARNVDPAAILAGVGLRPPGTRVVHNGHVAYGATTNHVDRQDLVVHRPRNGSRGAEPVQGYEVDGAFVPFELRRETFEVRGGEPVEAVVRFTLDGPLLNDLSPGWRGRFH